MPLNYDIKSCAKKGKYCTEIPIYAYVGPTNNPSIWQPARAAWEKKFQIVELVVHRKYQQETTDAKVCWQLPQVVFDTVTCRAERQEMQTTTLRHCAWTTR